MNILFYSEEGGFGGHEKLSCLAVRSLLKAGHQVAFAYNAHNQRLASALNELKPLGLECFALPVSVARMQYLRSPFQRNKIRQIRQAIRASGAQLLVVAQGRIESGTVAFLAARREGIRLVSYIPMAHAVAEIAPGWSAPLKESLNRCYYRMPDAFVTISQGIAQQLRTRGASAPMYVVENPVLTAATTVGFDAVQQLRARVGVAVGQRLVALIARIDFYQKRQDWLVEVLSQCRKLQDFRFLIVGDGPDRGRLSALVEAHGLQDRVFIDDWQEDLSAVYAAADTVLLCSRYEGIPLVMLEALRAGKPVVSSRIAGVADWLPDSWLFEPGSADGLVEALRRVSEQPQGALLEKLQDRVENVCQTERFCQRFESSLKECLEA